MIMGKIKLKPCPFCGCEMKIAEVCINKGLAREHSRFYLVAATLHEAGCMMGAMVTPVSGSKEELAGAWNRRAADD